MSITIRTKKIKDGYVTPYMDFHFNNVRWYEFFPGLKYEIEPKGLAKQNIAKEKKELLNRILRERELKMAMGEYDIKPKYHNKHNFFEYLDNYIDNYPNTGDARAYKSMRKKLKAFVNKPNLQAFEIDEAFLKRFVKYLEQNLNYETPTTYFKKLKKVLKLATKENIFRENPANDVKLSKHKTQEKEILEMDEIALLYEANCSNSQVKMAFLFAAYTGLRFVDINKLLWKNVVNNTLNITQSKTSIPISIPLHPSAIKFLGERKSGNDKVFNLPSHTGCLKAIRKWVKSAGIEKHITFHCARHTLGSTLVANGVDISVTARLLGHTSLKHTMRYVRSSEIMKHNAINTLQNL